MLAIIKVLLVNLFLPIKSLSLGSQIDYIVRLETSSTYIENGHFIGMYKLSFSQLFSSYMLLGLVVGLISFLLITTVKAIKNTSSKAKELAETKEQLNKALSLLDQVQDINNRLDDLEHNNRDYHRKE